MISWSECLWIWKSSYLDGEQMAPFTSSSSLSTMGISSPGLPSSKSEWKQRTEHLHPHIFLSIFFFSLLPFCSWNRVSTKLGVVRFLLFRAECGDQWYIASLACVRSCVSQQHSGLHKGGAVWNSQQLWSSVLNWASWYLEGNNSFSVPWAVAFLPQIFSHVPFLQGGWLWHLHTETPWEATASSVGV